MKIFEFYVSPFIILIFWIYVPKIFVALFIKAHISLLKSDKTCQFFVVASCIWYDFYSKKCQFTLHKWCRHLFVCLFVCWQTCLGRRPIWRWWHHKIWDTTFSNGIRCRLCWYWIEGSFVWTIKSVMLFQLPGQLELETMQVGYRITCTVLGIWVQAQYILLPQIKSWMSP